MIWPGSCANGTLWFQGKSNSVSCVKLCEPEQRVAFGCVSGILFIFQIQQRQVHDTKPVSKYEWCRFQYLLITITE